MLCEHRGDLCNGTTVLDGPRWIPVRRALAHFTDERNQVIEGCLAPNRLFDFDLFDTTVPDSTKILRLKRLLRCPEDDTQNERVQHLNAIVDVTGDATKWDHLGEYREPPKAT